MAAALLVSLSSGAGAQPALFPQQDLSFGTLTPGTPRVVTTSDVANRAEVELVGSGSITLEVVVPAALVSVGGQTLPVVFGPSDGMLRHKKGGQSVTFQPGTQFSFTMPPGIGGGFIWVGGTAQPSSVQAPGVYTGTLTVRILSPGT
jgi:hypothetical protein